MNINKKMPCNKTKPTGICFQISKNIDAISCKYFWVLFVSVNLLFNSCKVIESNSSEVLSLGKGSKLLLNYPKKISSDSIFTLKAQASGTNNVTIVAPYIAHIETLKDNTWERIRIQYCPCGANCKAPPKELILILGETHSFRWDLYESWCGKAAEDNIPNPMSKKAPSGNYRILVRYKTSQNETLKFHIEFEVY